MITFGGVLVVVSVIGILVFIVSEALPLFRSASAAKTGTLRLEAAAEPAAVAALGADDLGRYVYDVAGTGMVSFFDPNTGARLKDYAPSVFGAEVRLSLPIAPRRLRCHWDE